MPRKLKSISNFRDLGGIAAADGRHIKPNMLYRSGHHAALADRDAALLTGHLGIQVVADLRSSSEVSEHPDVKVGGIRYMHLPPLTDEQNPSVNKNNRKEILSRIMSYEGGARCYLCNIYRTMVTSPLSLASLGNLIRAMLKVRNGGILWHCTQGKDRAGTVTAVVLTALGVDRAEIMRDYLLTNRAYMIKNKLIFAGIAIVYGSLRAAKALDDLLTARAEYLQALFDEIDSRFGGSEVFLSNGLGLRHDEIDALREIYLA